MATLTLDDDTFDTAIAEEDTPIVVDFWAEWCAPCKKMAPHLEEVAGDMEGAVRIAKINVDEHPMSAGKHAVRGLPTLILFRGGKEIARHTGAVNRQRISDWIKENS